MKGVDAPRAKLPRANGVASTAVVGIGISALSVVVQLVIVILMGDRLGVAGIGEYLGWFSAIQLASTVARFGCGQLVIRLLAEPDDRSEAVRAARSFTTVSSVLLGILLSLGVFVVGGGFQVAGAVGVSVAFLTHLSVSAALLRGSRHVVTAQVFSPLSSTLVMLALVFFIAPDTPELAVGLQSVSFVVAAVVAALWTTRLPIAPLRPALSDLRPFIGRREPTALEARRLFATELTSMAAMWLPGVLLPVIASPAAAGLFGGANRMARPLLMVQAGVNNTVGPRIAGSKTDSAVAKRISRQGSLLTAGLAAPVVIVIVVGAGTLLSLLGEGFEEGASALIVLAVATYLGLATGPVNMLLSLRGHSSDSARGALLGLVVLICGLLLSSSAFQAALAVAANTLVRSIYGSLMVRRRFGFWVFPQYRRAN